MHSVGRFGADYYNELGYIPYNVGINESVARTLEYGFADFCIYELGKALGKPQSEIEIFAKRALAYKTKWGILSSPVFFLIKLIVSYLR